MTIDSSEIQFAKALNRIFFTVSGITTLLKFGFGVSHKKLSPIVVTGFPSIYAGITKSVVLKSAHVTVSSPVSLSIR